MELAKHKTDNDQLKQQLVAGTTEKVCPSYCSSWNKVNYIVPLFFTEIAFERVLYETLLILLGKTAEGAG